MAQRTSRSHTTASSAHSSALHASCSGSPSTRARRRPTGQLKTALGRSSRPARQQKHRSPVRGFPELPRPREAQNDTSGHDTDDARVTAALLEDSTSLSPAGLPVLRRGRHRDQALASCGAPKPPGSRPPATTTSRSRSGWGTPTAARSTGSCGRPCTPDRSRPSTTCGTSSWPGSTPSRPRCGPGNERRRAGRPRGPSGGAEDSQAPDDRQVAVRPRPGNRRHSPRRLPTPRLRTAGKISSGP
jgi:hypothetical protein